MRAAPSRTTIAAKIKTSHPLANVHSYGVLTTLDTKSKDKNSIIFIFLLGVEQPFLANMREEHFTALKIIVMNSTLVIWVTHSCGEKSLRSDLGLVIGLERNLTPESWAVGLIKLGLQVESNASRVINQIMKIYRKALLHNVRQDIETEYMEKDGNLDISRMVEAPVPQQTGRC